MECLINRGERFTSIGNCSMQEKNYREAIMYYDKAITLFKDKTTPLPKFLATAWNNKAEALQNIEEVSLAEEAYENALAILPDSQAVLLNYGNYLLENGDYNRAIEQFDKLIELNGEDDLILHKAVISLSLAYYHLGAYDSAYEKILPLTNDEPIRTPEALNVLGLTYFGQDLFLDALDAFSQAKYLDPDSTEIAKNWEATITQIASVYYDEGDIPSALEMYAKIPDNLKNDIILYNEGICYTKIKEPKKAELCLRKSLALNPDRSETKYSLAWTIAGGLDEKDDISPDIDCEEAKRLYQDIIDKEEDNSDIKIKAYNNIGCIFYLQKNYEEALKIFSDGISIRDDSPDLWQNKGQVLYSMGRISDAKDAFKKAEKYSVIVHFPESVRENYPCS